MWWKDPGSSSFLYLQMLDRNWRGTVSRISSPLPGVLQGGTNVKKRKPPSFSGNGGLWPFKVCTWTPTFVECFCVYYCRYLILDTTCMYFNRARGGAHIWRAAGLCNWGWLPPTTGVPTVLQHWLWWAGVRNAPHTYASTCSLCLYLPRGVVDEEQFKELVSTALKGSLGFGKASLCIYMNWCCSTFHRWLWKPVVKACGLSGWSWLVLSVPEWDCSWHPAFSTSLHFWNVELESV